MLADVKLANRRHMFEALGHRDPAVPSFISQYVAQFAAFLKKKREKKNLVFDLNPVENKPSSKTLGKVAMQFDAGRVRTSVQHTV